MRGQACVATATSGTQSPTVRPLGREVEKAGCRSMPVYSRKLEGMLGNSKRRHKEVGAKRFFRSREGRCKHEELW